MTHTTHHNPRTSESISFCDECGFESDGEHCSFCCDLGIGVCEDFACSRIFGPVAPWHVRIAAQQRQQDQLRAEALALTGEQLTLLVEGSTR